MSLFISITLLTLIGAACAYLANQRGRDPYIWFAIGVLLGLFGILILYLLPSLSTVTDEKTVIIPDDSVMTPKDKPLNEKEVMRSDWFCLDKMRKQQGPLSLNALKEQWEKGAIDAQSYVWSDGMSTWKHIIEITPLHETLQDDKT